MKKFFAALSALLIAATVLVVLVGCGDEGTFQVAVSGGKTEFFVGDEFSSEGLVVTMTSSGDEQKDVVLTAEDYVVDFSQYNANAEGSYRIVVKHKYKDISATYVVTVSAKHVDETAITALSLAGQKTEFAYNEAFDVGGLVVTATLSDVTTMVLGASQYEVERGKADNSTVGQYTVTVKAPDGDGDWSKEVEL